MPSFFFFLHKRVTKKEGSREKSLEMSLAKLAKLSIRRQGQGFIVIIPF